MVVMVVVVIVVVIVVVAVRDRRSKPYAVSNSFCKLFTSDNTKKFVELVGFYQRAFLPSFVMKILKSN